MLSDILYPILTLITTRFVLLPHNDKHSSNDLGIADEFCRHRQMGLSNLKWKGYEESRFNIHEQQMHAQQKKRERGINMIVLVECLNMVVLVL